MIKGGMPGAGRSAIRRSSLREQIADALREELMAGRLAAGQNFTVKEIADLYGVSATPAREALVDLAAQGLLRTEHHRGFTVPEFSWEDFLEIFETRTLLIDTAVRLLDDRITDHDPARVSSLRRRGDAAVRASRAGQLDVLVGCDLRFWQEATGVLRNERIAWYLSWLRVQSWMFGAPYLRAAGDLGGVCWDRYGELVDRFEAGDVDGARWLVVDHNLYTAELLARLAGKPLEPATVLPMLRGRSGGSTDGTGLGRVPLPRSFPSSGPVPATVRPGGEESAAGR